MTEQEYHWYVYRNICLSCYGKGYIDPEKGNLMNNMCFKCCGSGKRFQHLLKEGILE